MCLAFPFVRLLCCCCCAAAVSEGESQLQTQSASGRRERERDSGKTRVRRLTNKTVRGTQSSQTHARHDHLWTSVAAPETERGKSFVFLSFSDSLPLFSTLSLDPLRCIYSTIVGCSSFSPTLTRSPAVVVVVVAAATERQSSAAAGACVRLEARVARRPHNNPRALACTRVAGDRRSFPLSLLMTACLLACLLLL